MAKQAAIQNNTFNTNATYPCREAKNGQIIVGVKSSSWLSGGTLNALLAKGVVVIIKGSICKTF